MQPLSHWLSQHGVSRRDDSVHMVSLPLDSVGAQANAEAGELNLYDVLRCGENSRIFRDAADQTLPLTEFYEK